LSPPLLARKDPATGESAKMSFGPWMMKAFGVLAKFRRLRGTALDPFGYTAERRAERALIEEYRARVERALATLTPATHASAVAVAEVPEHIRGYGPIKERSIEQARRTWREMEDGAGRPPLAMAAE
jgi:indolepyruvate ferredoxin oxidoreductase